jgi:hypothetical protein
MPKTLRSVAAAPSPRPVTAQLDVVSVHALLTWSSLMTLYMIILILLHIVTAIANYTTRVATTSLSAAQRGEALKFLGMFCYSCPPHQDS